MLSSVLCLDQNVYNLYKDLMRITIVSKDNILNLDFDKEYELYSYQLIYNILKDFFFL